MLVENTRFVCVEVVRALARSALVSKKAAVREPPPCVVECIPFSLIPNSNYACWESRVRVTNDGSIGSVGYRDLSGSGIWRGCAVVCYRVQ